MLQIMILRIVASVMAKTSVCSGLTLRLGGVILGSVIATGLIPYREAIAQDRTYHGVRISPQLQLTSNLGRRISIGATPRQRRGISTYDRLGQWLPVPGSEDSYITYSRLTLSPSTENEKDLRSINLLTGTTSDNPRSISFSVDCAANMMSLSSIFVYSANGEIIGMQTEIEGYPVSPEGQFQQSLVDGVCKLGS